ncbi:MAG: NUDIX hydrolase [Bryobacteraceae bacterium]|nr:NUDIX hydrolase [Bryobacteraceae bacterium]
MQNPWKTLSSRIAYENPWIRVREDRVLRPDGQPGLYGVIELRPSVAIVALNEHEQVALVGQWRYPLDRYTWEIPRGASRDGESDILQAARRELREETGIEARTWRSLGAIDLCNGVMRSTEHLFLATDLTLLDAQPDPEEDLLLRWVSFDEAFRMVMENELREASSAAAILKTRSLLS